MHDRVRLSVAAGTPADKWRTFSFAGFMSRLPTPRGQDRSASRGDWSSPSGSDVTVTPEESEWSVRAAMKDSTATLCPPPAASVASPKVVHVRLTFPLHTAAGKSSRAEYRAPRKMFKLGSRAFFLQAHRRSPIHRPTRTQGSFVTVLPCVPVRLCLSVL